jgi:hypothetical protein
MKILWVSKHSPVDSQIRELKRLFGVDTVIDVDISPFSSAHDIQKRKRQGDYEEIVLIAPLSVCQSVVDLGIKPLYSEMISCHRENAEVEVQGTRERLKNRKRYYRFVKFKRLEAIEIKYSALDKVS